MLIDEIGEDNYIEKRIEGREELEKKFESFDALRGTNPTKFREGCADLFKDPTIWAFATLRDRENKRLRLWPYQDKFVNDRNRFIYCPASNQIGKTWAVIAKGLHHALHTPNASVIIISKSDTQATMLLDEMKWMMRRGSIDFDDFIDEVENRTELHLKSPKNGISTIRCFPPTTRVLGFPATLILLDEVDFWEKMTDLTPQEYYDQVIEPRTNTTKSFKHPFLTMGQIVAISNPNGKGGLGWYLYTDERFHIYRYCWLSNPNNSLKEYLYHKNRLPSYRFASIYAAEHIDASGGFITLDQYDRFASYNIPLSLPLGCVLYLGGDFASEDAKGKNTDWNTIYGVIKVPNKDYPGNPRIRVVYRSEWPPNTKKEVIYNEIARLKGLCTIGKFAYDKVGIGDKVKNDLIGRNILGDSQIEPLTYSLPNKSDVFLNLQSLFEHDLLEGRDIAKLKEQLLSLKVEQPPGSIHLKIHHKTGNLHDDDPDALANACFVARVSGQVSLSVVYPEKPKKKSANCSHAHLDYGPDGEFVCKDCGRLI